MIEFQQQGHHECLPTSLAMVLGIDKEEFVECLLLGTPYNFWAEVPDAERRNLLIEGLKYFGESWDTKSVTPIESMFDLARLSELAECSTGMIFTCQQDIEEFRGHTVAFSNGLVYDPAGEEPIPLPFWAMIHQLHDWAPFAYLIADLDEVKP